MQILFDSCLALLASIGLWTLGKMLFEYLLGYIEEPGNIITILICGNYTDFYGALWNDVDMSNEFRAFDICLCQDSSNNLHTEKYDGILCVKLKEAKKWTRKEKTIK